MTQNPFHPDALDPIGKSLTEILKGDLPGHEFRGNQYTQGSAQDTATRLAQFVTKNRGNISPYTAKDIAQAHVDHAGYHNKMAKYLHEQANAVALNGMGNVALAKQMEKEAQLHDKASSAHLAASETVLKAQGEWGGRLGLDEKKPTASQVSAASNAAAKATVAASGPQTTAALGWQTPDIQLPLGAPHFLTKGGPGSGAQAGHPFEGNQYATGGGRGDGPNDLAPWQNARNVATAASDIRANERAGVPQTSIHQSILDRHIAIGKELLKAAEDAKADPASATSQMVKDGIRGAELAAQAHFAAAQAHIDAAPFSNTVHPGAWEKSRLDHAEAASHAAAALTEDTMKAGQRANSRVTY